MARPITLCTGQWADLPLAVWPANAASWGFDGLELACWGDHFDVDQGHDRRRLLQQQAGAARRNTTCRSSPISNHLVGQAVLDIIDAAAQGVLPPYVWGDGDPAGVNARAVEEVKKTGPGRAAAGRGRRQRFHRFEHLASALLVPAGVAADDRRRLQAAGRAVPSDSRRVRRVRREVCAGGPPDRDRLRSPHGPAGAGGARTTGAEFGFNFDPSHLIWQGVDPAEFIREFPDRIYHVHMKDAIVTARRSQRASWRAI